MVFFDLLLPPPPPLPTHPSPTLQHEDSITALFVNYLPTVLPRAAAAHALLQPMLCYSRHSRYQRLLLSVSKMKQNRTQFAYQGLGLLHYLYVFNSH